MAENTSPAPDLLARARQVAESLRTWGETQPVIDLSPISEVADILTQLLARCEAAEGMLRRVRDGVELKPDPAMQGMTDLTILDGQVYDDLCALLDKAAS